MATKAKSKRKQPLPSQAPVTPPQSVGEVLLQSCMAEMNEKMVANYAIGIYRRAEMSEKEKKAFVEALYQFAVLGRTYWNYAKERGNL